MKEVPSERIARWLRGGIPDLKILSDLLKAGDLRQGRTLTALSGRHESLGLMRIAQGEYAKALGHFGAAAEAWAVLLERKLAGDEIADEVLDSAMSRPMSYAEMADDGAVLDRLRTSYAWVWGEDSVEYWIAEKMFREWRADRDALSEWLRQAPAGTPEPARKWSEALLARDVEGYQQRLNKAVEMWKIKIRTERLAKFPDAVCEHFHIAAVRVWMKMWNEIPDVDLEAAHVPREIFEVEPERISLGL